MGACGVDPHDRGVGREIDVEPSSIKHLRHQENVGQGERVSESVTTCRLVHVGFERIETSRDPSSGPGFSIQTSGIDLLEQSQVLHRLNARVHDFDELSNRAAVGGRARKKRGVRILFFEHFADRYGLRTIEGATAFAPLEHRDLHHRVLGFKRVGSLLTAALKQMDGQVFVLDLLERENDAHAPAGGASPIPVQLHAGPVPRARNVAQESSTARLTNACARRRLVLMKRDRDLGRSGLLVTRMGLGLAALGRPGYMTLGRTQDLPKRTVHGLEAQSWAVLDAAYAAGIRVFDVARSYGRAEAFLRSWIDARDHQPGAIVVTSKWGYTYMADWQIDAPAHEIKEHSLQRLLQQWELSRQQLWSHLDVYQIHSASLDTGVLDNGEVLDALDQLRSIHGVRIGLSLTGPGQAETLDKAMTVRIDGIPLFDVVQATWNPLEPSAGSVLLAAREAGMGVVIKESVANGRLTSRGLSTLAPAAREVAAQATERHGVSLDTWAVAAALAQPWADVVLSGAVTADQVTSNVRATDVKWTNADEDALSRLAEPSDAYWARRKALPWT